MTKPKTDSANPAVADRMAVARSKERIPQIEFIHAFQTSDGYRECAKKLGISERSVWVRARNFRKAGVRLKEYPHATGFSRINADRLNAIIDALTGNAPTHDQAPTVDNSGTATDDLF